MHVESTVECLYTPKSEGQDQTSHQTDTGIKVKTSLLCALLTGHLYLELNVLLL